MVRLKRKRRTRNDEDSILPLINVVFLLLIFFMIAGRLTASDPFEINPVRSASSIAPKSSALRIAVSADGHVAVEGEVIDRRTLGAAIAGRISDGKDLDIRLKADSGAEATQVIKILETLRVAGASSVQLMTVRGAESQ